MKTLTMSVTIGNVLGGKYRILRLIGDGGMGFVFEAVHEKLGTRVAIKVIHPEVASRPGIVERFLQEARVSAQIRSPHVAQVMDVDQTDGGEAYMVMELLEGQTLLAVLEREHKLSLEIAAEYTKQILEGLEAAHALGVVHRDLKPENVFVTVSAGKPVLKLIDFGIAKVRKDAPGATAENLTMAGITMGTAEYMAPEQAFSADRADARADIYAVGVILYEMLSGTRPVTGLDARLLAVKIEQGDVTPLIHAAPTVPPPIAGLVHQAMAPRPELRFQSATEMRLALERTLASGPATRVHVDASGTSAELDRTAAAGGTKPLPVVAAPGPKPGAPPAPSPLEAPPSPTTLRGEPVDPAAFARPPVAAAPAVPPAMQPAYGGPSRGGRRGAKGGSGLWVALVGLVVVGGLIGAVVYALSNRETSAGPGLTPSTTTPSASTTVASTVPTGPTTDPLQPLATLGTNRVPPTLPTGPVASTGVGRDGGVFGLPDAGTGAPPVPDAGTGLPNFPFPPPPDGGFVITIPRTIPLPTIPGFPPPAPQ